jgi:hypothetical protein
VNEENLNEKKSVVERFLKVGGGGEEGKIADGVGGSAFLEFY